LPQTWPDPLNEALLLLRPSVRFYRSSENQTRHSRPKVLSTSTLNRKCAITRLLSESGRRHQTRWSLWLTCTPSICPALVDCFHSRKSMEEGSERSKRVPISSDSNFPRLINRLSSFEISSDLTCLSLLPHCSCSLKDIH
ncbi:hypothetical protein PFISCL1PPCAC_14636, partial [Pristionchus fissidentatus]